jgi:hypothetical protein
MRGGLRGARADAAERSTNGARVKGWNVMRWLIEQIDRVADQIYDAVKKRIVLAEWTAAAAADQAAAAANRASVHALETVTARDAVLDAEHRLVLALQEARGWSHETTELRKAVKMTALAGEQLVRRAAMLEQIEKTIIRRIDIRIGVLENVLRQREELNRAERLRLNEEAEKWRLLAMSRIEATLEETPGRVAIHA